MRRLVLGLLALLVVVGAAATLPLHASAHALRQSSVPDANADLQQAPTTVVITFGEAPDPRLSSITVVSATNGQSYQNGPTKQVPGNPLQLEVALKSLPMGVYTVNWRTFSAVDGHIAGGAFAFGVRQDPASVTIVQPPITPPGPSILDIIARSILFVGLVALVGGAGIATMVLPRPGRAVVRVLPASWAIAAAGVVLVTASQAHNAGVGPGEIFHTSIGHAVLERGVPLVVAGLFLPLCFAGGIDRRRVMVGVTGLAGAAAMLGDVLNSHAAAGSDETINVAMQWVHIAAVAMWLGGLLALLIGIRELDSEARGQAVRRFSTMAGVALVLVAATGTIRAFIEIGAWGRVWGNAFGVLVVVKAALIGTLAGLGAVNRFVNVPKASRVVSGLRRVGSTEVLVALSTLVVAAALVNEEPPATQAQLIAAAAPQQIVLNANDYGTSVRMRLTITPGTTGPDLYTAVITDYDTGRSLSAAGVQLGFTAPSCNSLGPTTLVLKNSGPGAWSATGSNLALGTTWQVTALVNRGSGSVEIPFTVTPKEPAQTLKQEPVTPGLPTLYDITLPVGSLQIYIDPEKPGAVEFHTTYFDPSGNGLSTAVVSSVTEDGKTLTSRQLGPGHYVSDAVVKAGPNTLKISATSGCEPLNSTITINVKG